MAGDRGLPAAADRAALAENRDLAELLRQGAELLERQGANPFRVRAYRRGAERLERLALPAREILAVLGREGLIDLPDIGLPELVTTFAAVRIGAFDLALGNVFGSNAFNVVILVPLDFVSSGPLLVDVSAAHAVTALAVVVVTGVAVLGQLYRAERRWLFLEPDAALVILLVALTLWGLYFLR